MTSIEINTRATINHTEKALEEAACNGQLMKVINLAPHFRKNAKLLSETLLLTCRAGHLAGVQWLINNTSADVYYSGQLKLSSA